jgi:hypothetical protein
MPLVDSRLGPGTITFGAVAYSYQASNVRLSPSIDETDGTPTLAEPAPAPLAKVKWALAGTVIQDFDEPLGFVNWAMDNALDAIAFVFVPATASGTSYAGTVQIRPVEIGGDAGGQITTDFEFPIIGDPVRTDPAGGMARVSARRQRSDAGKPRATAGEPAGEPAGDGGGLS